MRFEPFKPEHLFLCEPQGDQAPFVKWMTPNIAEMAAGFFSFTGFDGQDRIIGCAGLAPADSGDLVAWALFSPLLGSHALGVTRAVKQGLDLHRTRRVVAHVHPDHAKASAFAKRLSFQFAEARADLHPSGALMHVYVREGR